jgi:ribosomal-protein-serine acetyltransferase
MRKIKADEEIVLREISLSTAQLIFDSIDRSRNHLREWLPFVDSTKSVTDTRNFIKSVLASSCPKKDMIFEIWYLKQFAGLIGFKEIDLANRKAEIGYWLDANMTGKGIMIRSCKELINYAFQELDLNRVMIKVAVGNTKSQAIPKNTGLRMEGIEREGELIYDNYLDLEVFSVLKNEWTK